MGTTWSPFSLRIAESLWFCESLLCGSIVLKGELIVNYESEVFEAVYCLYGFVVIDGVGVAVESQNNI